MVDDFKDDTCPECDGECYVTWHYRDKDGIDHEKESDCPVCNGRGYVRRTKIGEHREYDDFWPIAVGPIMTLSRSIYWLRDVMDLLSLWSVNIRSYSVRDGNAVYMEADNGIKLIFTRILWDEEDEKKGKEPLSLV